MPVQPSAPKTADQVAPQHVPEAPGKSSPQPAFAPAPPITKEERGAPAVESPHGDTLPPGPGVSSVKRAKKGAAVVMEKALGTGEQETLKSEEARGASGARGGAALPQVRIRLHMTTPASAPGSLREAVTRSGGSVIDDGRTGPDTVKARIPSPRMGELLDRLGRLGSFVERPQTPNLPGMVEIVIGW